ncbi:MAG: TRAP transporter small permease subunit [Rhodospirillaceae bacterium]|nr:TRAP transporter small permease subunit [Rhodospirillaceae bacterium]
MAPILRLASAIDRLNDVVGRTVSWLAVFLVLCQFALVILRYVFGVGSIFMQESILYAHGAMLMLAAGYALAADGHVRVDIFYREGTARRKALINLIGVIVLLLPFAAVVGITAWPYVLESWLTLEGSRETSGIPALFLLKSVIVLFALLLALQGVALGLRSLACLSGHDDGLPGDGPAPAADGRSGR